MDLPTCKLKFSLALRSLLAFVEIGGGDAANLVSLYLSPFLSARTCLCHHSARRRTSQTRTHEATLIKCRSDHPASSSSCCRVIDLGRAGGHPSRTRTKTVSAEVKFRWVSVPHQLAALLEGLQRDVSSLVLVRNKLVPNINITLRIRALCVHGHASSDRPKRKANIVRHT